MKRTLSLLASAVLALAMAAGAYAQGSVGIGYSMNLNKMSSYAGKSIDDFHGVNFRVGYNFELAYGQAGILALESGLLYDYLTSRDIASIHEAMTAAEASEHYLSVPAFLNYGFDMGSWMPYIFAGPMLSLGLASQVQIRYTYNAGASKGNIVIHNYSDKVTSKISDNLDLTGEAISKLWQAGGGMGYGRFDVKVGMGIGVKVLENTDFRLQYHFGLLNRYNGGKVTDAKMLTDQIYLTVAYCF